MEAVERRGPERTDADEAGTLAEELGRGYGRMVEFYQRKCEQTPKEAIRSASEVSPEYLDQVLNGPRDQVSWFALGNVAERDPDLAARRWDDLKEAARAELRCGHRAATTLASWAEGPWDRARFLAIRAELAEEWKPTGGMEWSLIDMLAQAYCLMEHWQRVAAERLYMEVDKKKLREEKGEKWLPPRLHEAEAEERAMAMVERWNRVYLRTLRALRDLRRYAPTVNIQNVGQVNIGDKQVNVCKGKST